MMNNLKRITIYFYLTGIILNAFSSSVFGQVAEKDTLLQEATLQNCIQFALKHYPLVQQSLLNEQITDQQIKSKLSEWYPQLNLNAFYDYYFQLQAVNFN